MPFVLCIKKYSELKPLVVSQYENTITDLKSRMEELLKFNISFNLLLNDFSFDKELPRKPVKPIMNDVLWNLQQKTYVHKLSDAEQELYSKLNKEYLKSINNWKVAMDKFDNEYIQYSLDLDTAYNNFIKENYKLPDNLLGLDRYLDLRNICGVSFEVFEIDEIR